MDPMVEVFFMPKKGEGTVGSHGIWPGSLEGGF